MFTNSSPPSTRRTLRLLVPFLAVLASACGGAAAAQPRAHTVGASVSGGGRHAAPVPQGFRGIFEFAGGNSSADAADPVLAGVDLVYYWSQIEPQRGVFDWSAIDTAMAPWIAAGKKVALRVSTAGAPGWDPPYSGSGTPTWVYGDGTAKVHDNGSTFPRYWDKSYLADYRSFVTALGRRYDGDPHVAFVEPGIGMGGETLPETNASSSGVRLWQASGYNDARWLRTVEKVAGFFRSSFTKTPVYPLVDRTFFDGSGRYFDDVMAWLRGRSGWGLQDDGLSASQTLSTQWSGPPLALEQLYATKDSGDCLCADLGNGIHNLHGTYLLIYRSDVDAAANAAYLAAAAQEATGH